MIFGHVGKGAQRWLDLGFIKFQPSEFLKIVMPMTVAQKVEAWKAGLGAKIEKANKDLAEMKYDFKCN
jgi:cell division protein FtsW (lipid II flippase)